MNTRTQNDVVELAQTQYRRLWKEGSEEGQQSPLAKDICREWQKAVKDKFSERFSKKHSVGSGFNERIDLVDKEEAIAYELKISTKNPDHEFYSDIFKAIVHNQCNVDWKIKKMVFINPQKGASKLRTHYGNKVCAIAKEQHGIEVEICAI